MANVSSAQYTSIYVNKYLAGSRQLGGKTYNLPFSHVVGTEASGDTVNLAVIPANAMVINLIVSNDALGASTTLAIGDAGSATRFLAATAVTAAGKNNGLLSAGQNYIPTVDTILLATWGGATPTAAGVIKGVLQVILPES